jgi:prolyl-tRNA synthetase
MRCSRYHIPTLKEAPADAQVASHALLIRGGYLRRLAAGIYTFLPLGIRVVRRIEQIIREEMDRAGALELLLPAAIPGELWQESGRWNEYGPELLRFTDRKGAAFCIGPTHEEVIVDLVRRDVRSYRQLPLNLYQIQSKFRDELRPRAGLLRGREFIMKDAYSFDVSAEAAQRTYQAMVQAYRRIFRRCGLDFRPVEADTGAIGGSMSHEFQVLAESGEDTLVSCDRCDYAANVEKAELGQEASPADDAFAPGAAPPAALERVPTPGQRTIDEVSAFLGVPAAKLAKTLIYRADGRLVAAMVRGDHQLGELKLKQLLGAGELAPASDVEVEQATGAPVGFAGPIGLGLPVYADRALARTHDLVVGANAVDLHYRNVNLGRDFQPHALADLRAASPGDPCPRCAGGRFRGHRGIEVGHVFYLGTKYSAPMGCTFLDESGGQKPMVMGCYGIGVTRIAAAAVEQHHDPNGIIWPLALAPFAAALVVDSTSPECVACAEELYAALTAAGLEVLYDDRDERMGAKFKDADLVGIPLRVTIGKKSLAEGAVELKHRRDREAVRVPRGELCARLCERVRLELGASTGEAGA